MLDSIYERLLNFYGKQFWWPIIRNNKIDYSVLNENIIKNPEEIFEISIGAILTQNTSWKNVEKSLLSLKNNNINSFESLLSFAKDNKEELLNYLKPTGYYNQKFKKIIIYSDFIYRNKLYHQKEILKIEMPRKVLLSLWGIGRETADSILLYAYSLPFFVIDKYTVRLFSRLGFVKEDLKYDELQAFVYSNINRKNIGNIEYYKEYHALIVKHSVSRCFKNKPLCNSCPLLELCRYPSINLT